MTEPMLYDNNPDVEAPNSLQSTQEWFAGVITNKMEENSYINTVAPSGYMIAEEASRYIVPSAKLRPHQRMQIYNQQYWWRLLNAMHENFPFVTRLFGYYAFNETIGIPFLLKYPPNHWSLTLLGERLTKWIEEEYHAPDQKLILNAANLDWCFSASFIAPNSEPLDLNQLQLSDPEQLLNYTFYLQPHIHLFKWDYNLMAFRESFMKQDVDYWTEHDFPELPKEKTYYFMVYRSFKNDIHWREISSGEHTLLEMLRKGSSIETACEILEKNDESIYSQAVQHLQAWLQEWVGRGWLTLNAPGQLIS